MSENTRGQHVSPADRRLESYPPSWFDRLSRFVDSRRAPYWLVYLLLGAGLAVIGALLRFMDDGLSPFAFDPFEFLALLQTVFVLSLMTYLNTSAAKALETFRPVLKGDQDQASLLLTNLTTMPARSINRLTVTFFIVFSILASLLATTDQYSPSGSSAFFSTFTVTSGFYSIYIYSLFALLWLVNSIFIYNTIHQLRTINHAFTKCTEIRLFNQTELYAFTRVLAVRSIGFVLTSPLWLIVDAGIVNLIINLVFSLLAMFIFFSPLLGVHRLLENQKQALLKQSSLNKEVLIQQLFSRLEQGKLNDTHEVGEALSDLSQAHEGITAISTWPWQTHTIRQIAGAIALPLFIWLVQFFLSRWLSA